MQEEVPWRVGGNEEMDKRGKELAAMHDPQQSEVKAARLLELLQRAGQLDDDVEVSCSRNEASLQMAQPPQSEAKLHVDKVQRVVDEGLADPSSALCGARRIQSPTAIACPCLIKPGDLK